MSEFRSEEDVAKFAAAQPANSLLLRLIQHQGDDAKYVANFLAKQDAARQRAREEEFHATANREKREEMQHQADRENRTLSLLTRQTEAAEAQATAAVEATAISRRAFWISIMASLIALLALVAQILRII